MSKEFFEAVKMLESEKGISADYLYEKNVVMFINKTINDDTGLFEYTVRTYI